MQLNITTGLAKDSDPNKAILQMFFNGEWVGQMKIDVPEGFTTEKEFIKKRALDYAGDSPLFTLYDTIEQQITEALEMMGLGMKEAYQRAKKDQERFDK